MDDSGLTDSRASKDENIVLKKQKPLLEFRTTHRRNTNDATVLLPSCFFEITLLGKVRTAMKQMDEIVEDLANKPAD